MPWNTANDAVLAEGNRVLIEDPGRFDGVKVMRVDEHVWRHTRRGDKHVTVIIDLTPIRDGDGPARLVDMVEGRSKQAFKTWPTEREESWRDAVEVVAMDAFTGFKTATTEELFDAVAVMGLFHVVRLAGDALDQCRRRVQQAILPLAGSGHASRRCSRAGDVEGRGVVRAGERAGADVHGDEQSRRVVSPGAPSSLVDSMTGDYVPKEFADDYRDALQALISAKLEGGEASEAPMAVLTSGSSGQVVDLLAALQRSVEAAQGRAGSPRQPQAPVKKAVARKAPATKATSKAATTTAARRRSA